MRRHPHRRLERAREVERTETGDGRQVDERKVLLQPCIHSLHHSKESPRIKAGSKRSLSVVRWATYARGNHSNCYTVRDRLDKDPPTQRLLLRLLCDRTAAL